MTEPSLHERIQTLLTAPDSPHLLTMLELAADSLLAQPASFGLPAAEVSALLASALTEDNVERWLARGVTPLAERVYVRLEGARETVGDLLPEAAREHLPALLAEADGPRLAWLSGALEPADLRELLAPVVAQTLVQFASRLPGMGGAGALSGSGLGSLLGSLGKSLERGARELADVGRNVVGGISSELERRLQGAAQDFSHTAVERLREALRERLASEEGKVIVGRIRRRVVEQWLATPVAELARDAASAPLSGLAAHAPSIVAFGSQTSVVRAAIEVETSALLSTLGERSLRELLLEAGLYEEARELLLQALAPALGAFVASNRFDQFLRALLSEAGA